MIDRIRHDIQELLEQLLGEVEKLRGALAALDPREKPSAQPAKRSASADAITPTRRAATSRGRTVSSRVASSSARPARGETRAKVLDALSAEGGMTAGEVAEATGLGRGTVSTTLSKLAKSGDVIKADRGYRLPAASKSTAAESEASASERS